MPVDLTPDGRFNDLNATLLMVVTERDECRTQLQAAREKLQDVDGLYDELCQKDEEIVGLREENRLVLDQVGPLRAENTDLRGTLQDIADRNGRGALKLAQAALAN